jgi:hypothetical protein
LELTYRQFWLKSQTLASSAQSGEYDAQRKLTGY